MNNLVYPKEGGSQKIGRLAGKALLINIPETWIETDLSGDTDFGIDYTVQVKNSNDEVLYSFYLQLKGTTNPNYLESGKEISHTFESKSLNLYRNTESAVMVALVDLSKYQNTKIWDSPIYYKWLDEEYLSSISDKLLSNSYITTRIPIEQKINSNLNIESYLLERIEFNIAANKLGTIVSNNSYDPCKIIKKFTSYVELHPSILDVIQDDNDYPWIENSDDHCGSDLQKSNNFILSNRLSAAIKLLNAIENKGDLSNHEKAELLYQHSIILTLEGSQEEALVLLEKSKKLTSIKKYELHYIDALFAQKKPLSKGKLRKIRDEMDETIYKECLLKSKCIVLLDDIEGAISLIEKNFPEKTIAKLMISSIGSKGLYIDNILNEIQVVNLKNNREKFIYYIFYTKRLFSRALKGDAESGKVLPLHGKTTYDFKLLNLCLENLRKGWEIASLLGYPIDTLFLLDISMHTYCVFNYEDELVEHILLIHKHRQQNHTIVKHLSTLYFNQQKYELVISIINKMNEIQPDLISMYILSHYNLQKFSELLILVEEHENVLLKFEHQNDEFVFCIAAQCASEMFEPDLEEKYLKLVPKNISGKISMALFQFIKGMKSHPEHIKKHCKNMYGKYIELGRPTSIAYQLFLLYSAFEKDSSLIIIDLTSDILQERELLPNEYLHYCQALITLEKWNEVLKLSSSMIKKGNREVIWEIAKSGALYELGDIPKAKKILSSICKFDNSKTNIHESLAILNLKFGNLDFAENSLKELLIATPNKQDKISILDKLIYIYSSQPSYSVKLKIVLLQYGNLVNTSNEIEEGNYLLLFMTFSNNDKLDYSDYLEEFKERLDIYVKKFPNSRIIRTGNIHEKATNKEMIKTLQKFTGLTDQQISQFKRNRNLLRY